MGLIILLSTQIHLSINTMQPGDAEDTSSFPGNTSDVLTKSVPSSKKGSFANDVYNCFSAGIDKIITLTRDEKEEILKDIKGAIPVEFDPKSATWKVATLIMQIIDQMIMKNDKLQGLRSQLAQEFFDLIAELELNNYLNKVLEKYKPIFNKVNLIEFSNKSEDQAYDLTNENDTPEEDINVELSTELVTLHINLLLSFAFGNNNEVNDLFEQLSSMKFYSILDFPNEVILKIFEHKIDKVIKKRIGKSHIGKSYHITPLRAKLAIKKALMFINKITLTCKKLYFLKPALLCHLQNYIKQITINRCLFVACFLDYIDLAYILLSSGRCKLNIPYSFVDCIINACIVDHIGIVKLLLAHGANLEEKNLDGDTALIRMIFNNKIRIVKFLLDSDASPYTPNKHNKSPLAILKELSDKCLHRKHAKIELMIMNKIAELEAKTSSF